MNVDAASRAIHDLLVAIGENVERDGLRGTPDRAARAWAEITAGYGRDPSKVLRTSEGTDGFEAGGYDQMIVVAGIGFWSTCEHHLMPFGGIVDVAYLPGTAGRVVGLSKIPRLVEVYARRLQIQEQMTNQIAEALEAHLNPIGVGVRVRATHLCTSCRGVRKRVQMVTSRLTGRFREAEVRAEFWALAKHGGKQ